jgi:putative intracellular protease/amidase
MMGIIPTVVGQAPLTTFNVESAFQAVRALNDLLDKARANGWVVTLTCGDYAALDASKVQKGNGP